MIGSLHARLRRVNDWIVRQCERALVMLLVLIVGILFVSVVWRYVLFSPISWAPDAALFCLVWMTLLGAPVGIRGGHVAVTSVLEAFPDGAGHWLIAAVNLSVLLTALIIVQAGFPLVMQGMARIVPSIDWLAQGYIYAALPVGFALVVPLCVENMLGPFVVAAPSAAPGPPGKS